MTGFRREGRLRESAAGGIRAGAADLFATNIEPRNMSREELVAGYRRLVREL